ncbi:MAG: phosphoribosylformylglycinamidine synthase subunit PurQ [candidate division WOR-3 bacterium]
MVKALILRGPGTNCDVETGFAFSKAGADVEFIFLDALLRNPKILSRIQILAIPGGFTYGDDLGAGTAEAARLTKIKDEILNFVEKGNLIIGICNGFQILIKMKLLPGFKDAKATLTLIPEAKFRDEWLTLKAEPNHCVFTKGIETFRIPMANSEGRLFIGDERTLNKIEKGGYVALRYFGKDPTNSSGKIAGLCDKTGRILGLMPHPERNIFKHSPPDWQDGKLGGEGLKIFKNAVDYFN